MSIKTLTVNLDPTKTVSSWGPTPPKGSFALEYSVQNEIPYNIFNIWKCLYFEFIFKSVSLLANIHKASIKTKNINKSIFPQ